MFECQETVLVDSTQIRICFSTLNYFRVTLRPTRTFNTPYQPFKMLASQVEMAILTNETPRAAQKDKVYLIARLAVLSCSQDGTSKQLYLESSHAQ